VISGGEVGARDRVWRLRSPEGGDDRRQGEGGFLSLFADLTHWKRDRIQ